MIHNKAELEDFLHTLIVVISGKIVIWDKQNAARPQKPYLCIQHISSTHNGFAEIQPTDGDNVTVKTIVTFGYQLDYYGNNAVDELQNIERRLSFPTIVDQCAANNVTISATNYGQDGSRLLDSLKWEERAFIDFDATTTILEQDLTYYIAEAVIDGYGDVELPPVTKFGGVIKRKRRKTR